MTDEIVMTRKSRIAWMVASWTTALIVLCAAITIGYFKERDARAEKEAEYQEISAMYATAATHLATVKAEAAAYLAFVKNSPYPVAIIDSRGTVIYWSPAAEKDTGYTFEEIKAFNQGVLPIVPEEMRPVHQEKMTAAFDMGKSVGEMRLVECQRLHKSGGRRWIVMTVMMFDDVEGHRYCIAQWVRRSRVEAVEQPKEPTSALGQRPLALAALSSAEATP